MIDLCVLSATATLPAICLGTDPKAQVGLYGEANIDLIASASASIGFVRGGVVFTATILDINLGPVLIFRFEGGQIVSCLQFPFKMLSLGMRMDWWYQFWPCWEWRSCTCVRVLVEVLLRCCPFGVFKCEY